MNKSDIFNDKTKQLKLLNKFPPGFIKFDNDGKIEINRTVKLNIPLENMTFSSTTKFNRQTIHNENSYDDSLFSSDSKGANAKISKSIKNILNISLESNLTLDNKNKNHKKSKYIHYKHLISQSYIKISIPQKDFILDENIKKEFQIIKEKKTDKEKLNELFKLYNKYGFGVPFEFILGGKYYIYYDAKSEEEKQEMESKINNITSLNFNEQTVGFNFNNNNNNEVTNKVENLNFQMDVIGGDIEKKDDYNGWLKSLNVDNYEIVKYESVNPIHDYFDDELKNEIDGLLERENEKILLEKEREEQEEKASVEQAKEVEHVDKVIADPVTIMVLGDNDSGKTTLIKRYLGEEFNSMETTTIAQEYYSKISNFKIDNKIFKIKAQLVDNVVNNERLEEMDLSYIRHCDGIILVVDSSNEGAQNRLNIWGDSIKYYLRKNNIPIFLVSNKSDLTKKVNISEEFKNKYGMVLIENISCKYSKKYSDLKEEMKTIIIESYKNKKKKADNIVYKKSGFCY